MSEIENERIMMGNKLWKEYRAENYSGAYMDWLEMKLNELREKQRMQEHQTESIAKASMYYQKKS